MKNNLPKIMLLCTFFLFSCGNKKTLKKNKTSYNSGVVLTFDDTTINEWFEADHTLKKYSWKATFCVSKINTLSHSEIEKLLHLQSEGHEIAGHSLNHFNATTFVAQNGINEYINQEINPMLDLMNHYSLKVSSFAYPFGFRNKTIDTALLCKFKIVRGTTYGSESPSQQNCYYNNSKLVYGIGIDTRHPSFSIPYLLKLLDYAKRNHKILILFGHKPVTTVTANYQTEMKTLNLICNYVKQNKMKFYTLSELDHLKQYRLLIQNTPI